MSDVEMTGPLRGPLRKRDSLLWSRETNDWYIEPEWCSERLFEKEQFQGRITDPACGTGRILDSARAAGYDTTGFDIINRNPDHCAEVRDFLEPMEGWYGNIVSNPPFKHAEAFAKLALERSTGKVALLMPANWVQGDKRSRWLATTPLRKVLFIAPRPSMPPGHVIAAGGKPGNGTTDYAWFIWLRGFDGRPELGWLHRDGEGGR